MASGFKQATVNASDVPATQTDFPAYVDLSRIGITTQAEADSTRCYSDSGKTTELAREIVSATEMHVKIPSLTSTFTLYVDYDGVRSDYAVGATYGRNAVWSDYAAVYHMNEDPSGTAPQIIDSTGNGINGTSLGTMTSGDLITAQIGNGLDFDGSNDKIDFGDVDADIVTNSTYTFSIWFKADTTSGVGRLLDMQNNNQEGIALFINNGNLFYRQWDGSSYIDRSYTFTDTTNYHKADIAWDGSKVYDYLDSTLKNVGGTSCTGYVNASDFFVGGRVVSTTQYLNGVADEVRVTATNFSGNWIVAEYNNQNDEATFWGTWTDAAAGAVFIPKILQSS